MVPGNDLLRLDENYHSFGSLDRYGLASTIIQGAIVALPDCLAYALDDCAVIANNGMPFELLTFRLKGPVQTLEQGSGERHERR